MFKITTLLAGNFDNVGKLLESFLAQWWGPLIGIVAAAAGILAVAAGLKYVLAAQSGDDQKLKQAKHFVIGIVIAIVIMFVLASLIPVIIAAFQSWYENDAQEYLSLVVNVI